jgi:hypothetical protein
MSMLVGPTKAATRKEAPEASEDGAGEEAKADTEKAEAPAKKAEAPAEKAEASAEDAA